MSNFWRGYITAGIIATIIVIVMMLLLSGCQTHAVSTTLDKTPSSGWESTMNAVAKTNWFGTFCLLSFFGGVVAIGLDQRKIGGAVIIAAISTLCLGLAVHRFPTWLAIIGFASSVIAVGYSILIKNKALIEIVKGVQNYRNLSSNRKTIDIYLNNPAQSKSTKKIVAKIKAKNGNKNT